MKLKVGDTVFLADLMLNYRMIQTTVTKSGTKYFSVEALPYEKFLLSTGEQYLDYTPCPRYRVYEHCEDYDNDILKKILADRFKKTDWNNLDLACLRSVEIILDLFEEIKK